ncbi:MAG: nuclear transport factor 2 family protein [Rudaea sp.]
MKKIAAMMLVATIATARVHAGEQAAAVAHEDLAQTLIAREKLSWEAWKTHDDRFFAGFLSEDHVDVGTRGVTNKQQVVAGVASPACHVEDYAVDQFRVTRLSADAAIVVYHARQKTLCGTAPVPSPAWVSSLYVRREGRWLNALFQQSPTDH